MNRAFFDEKKLKYYNEALNLISYVLGIPKVDITNINDIKLGMTNHSFAFTIKDNRYICRVPGEGTDKLINRANEHASIEAVKSLGISENVLYHSAETGYKIAEYLVNARIADKNDPEDLKACMARIRQLHEASITVDHEFDIAKEIFFYENLCLESGEIPFEDYEIVRKHSLELVNKLSAMNRQKTLCHVDCIPDNCLFTNDGLKIIDWEYAGMADPLIDVAAFCIYSYYDEAETDRLVDLYFEGVTPSDTEKGIVYAYMALLGLCWTLWAVYKENLGVSFGEYLRIQYRYARDFYFKAMALL